MTASRILTLWLGLAFVGVCGGAVASDTGTETRPIADDVPSFRAPEDPPEPPDLRDPRDQE